MQAALDTLGSPPLTGSEVNDLTARLKRAMIEHALNAEMSLHLSYGGPVQIKKQLLVQP